MGDLVALASYRRPILDGLTVRVRGQSVELSQTDAQALSEAIYWVTQLGQPQTVGRIRVSEVRRAGGIRVQIGSSSVTMSRGLAFWWVEVLHTRAQRRAV